MLPLDLELMKCNLKRDFPPAPLRHRTRQKSGSREILDTL
jgi:hypothetical protein